MSNTPKEGAEIITGAELANCGLMPQDVRRRCPWAVEYTALDGSPCWLLDDLAELLAEQGKVDTA